MPKAPRHPHPLHHIRKVKGMTQAKLASALGVSEALVQKIELGGKMSDSLKLRVLNLYGIRPESLEPRQMPRSLFQSPSCNNRSLKAAIAAWEQLLPVIDDVISMQCDNRFVPMLRVLFEAARDAKRSASLATSFEGWFRKESRKLRLDSKAERLLAENKISTKPFMQWFRRGDTLRLSLCLPDATDEQAQDFQLRLAKAAGVDPKFFPKGTPARALAKHDKA